MFNEEKATALAREFLLKTDDKTMDYMKLIKLMYIADRRMLEQNEAPFTNDTYVAMKNGMVLSNVYNLIKYNAEESNREGREDRVIYWKKFIETIQNYKVKLTDNVFENNIHMTENEKNVIDDVWREYGSKNQWDMVKILHKRELFPEWEDPYPYGVNTVSIYELLSHMDKTPEEVSIILDKIEGI